MDLPARRTATGRPLRGQAARPLGVSAAARLVLRFEDREKLQRALRGCREELSNRRCTGRVVHRPRELVELFRYVNAVHVRLGPYARDIAGGAIEHVTRISLSILLRIRAALLFARRELISTGHCFAL